MVTVEVYVVRLYCVFNNMKYCSCHNYNIFQRLNFLYFLFSTRQQM